MHWKPRSIYHDARFVAIGPCCRYDSLWCLQGLQSWHYDNSRLCVVCTVNKTYWLKWRHMGVSTHWLLWGEFTGDQWILLTKGQQRRKCFHLMKSSCIDASRVLTPVRRQGITWNNADVLSIGPSGTNVDEILFEMQKFYRKNAFRMSFANDSHRSMPQSVI